MGKTNKAFTAGNILGLTSLITVRKANENRVSTGLNMMSAPGSAKITIMAKRGGETKHIAK